MVMLNVMRAIVKSLQRFTSTDIPLSGDAVSRYLPWLLGFLMYLAALLVTLVVAFQFHVGTMDRADAHSFTLQLPPGSDAASAVKAVRARMDAVQSVDAVPPSKVRTLLKPWLGEGAGTERMPLPVIVQVQLLEGTAVTAAEVATRLQPALPGVRVHARAEWLERFGTVFLSMRVFSLALVGLILAVLAGVITIVTRTELKLHADAIALLEGIGATDAYVARQFQAHALQLAGRGAGIALVLLAPTLVAMHFLLAGDSVLLPDLQVGGWAVLSLATLIAGSIGLASLVAKGSVLRMLRVAP